MSILVKIEQTGLIDYTISVPFLDDSDIYKDKFLPVSITLDSALYREANLYRQVKKYIEDNDMEIKSSLCKMSKDNNIFCTIMTQKTKK
jgi:hypothetical protein